MYKRNNYNTLPILTRITRICCMKEYEVKVNRKEFIKINRLKTL
jgi:hypothetical protein